MRFKSALVSVALLLVAGAAVAAEPPSQAAPLSTDGTDPRTWDPALDALASGAKNHKLIYEDEEIRVLSVTVLPGEKEIPHHHIWPSVIVYDRPVKSENRDAKGNLLPRKASAGGTEWPPVVRVPPRSGSLRDEPRHRPAPPHPRRVQEGCPSSEVGRARRRPGREQSGQRPPW